MMSRENAAASEVRQALCERSEREGFPGARVHVASTSIGRWRVRIVHDGLRGIPDEERRARLLGDLDDDVEVAELVTSAEEEWYGPVFLENEGSLPLWPEAMGQESSEQLIFASDLDEDIEPPAVVTFYSLRGGVGRTTALASAARLLASRGRRVVCIDMDFEAPGLPHLFGLPEPESAHGALPLLLDLERGEQVDVRDHVQRVSEAEELYCLPAGRLGVEYAERLGLVEPESWYREQSNPMREMLDLVAGSTISPDIVLLDARTGISPISAPLLFDVSDLAVVCFFPHPQAARGTELLVRSLFAARTRRSGDGPTVSPEPRFLVSPVPPGPSAAAVRARALGWIDEWLSEVQDRRSADVGPLQGDELTHLISYSAEVAFRDSVEASQGLTAYEPVADWLEQLLPRTGTEEQVRPSRKRQVLRELDFSTGTADDQERFVEDFVRTRISSRAMDARFPLVIGRKGTGKTAVFRWLLEAVENERPVPVMCPNAFRPRFPWVLGAEGFSAIERRLGERMSWTAFWACCSALAICFSCEDGPAAPPPERLGIRGDDLPSLARDIDDVAVVELVSTMLENPESGLLAGRWLREMDANLGGHRYLLFDGLDTGFGNDAASRERRTRAITGLFTFLTETEPRLSTFSFKVLLRLDIWQSLVFENKSHLHGRSVQLLWRDQAEYFKTALKQAVRSPGFQELLGESGIGLEVDTWNDDEVFRAWNLLVGERMKGGKTTFTRNWVWNRLADGQGNHGPRTLLRLFSSAVEWETREEERNPYGRSVIRPRGLVPGLERVSDEAVQALREEFSELHGFIRVLEQIGRTPLDPREVGRLDPEAAAQADLATEVGLVAVHEGAQENQRFRVPDLYRHALGMSRKGQA
ncbi:MAG: hypothetical protein QG608_2869 [Actinomycetota bacterium]|nr:hypothetical protein [Actinomycetota bacterium]